MQVDNPTTYNYVHDTLQQTRFKSFDMKLHWLSDRTNRKQFHVQWAKGEENLADCYSKHHLAAHVKKKNKTQVLMLANHRQNITSYYVS